MRLNLLPLLVMSASLLATQASGQLVPIDVADVANGAWAYDNGSFFDIVDHDAMSTLDRDTTTYWAGLAGTAPQVMTIGFASTALIDEIRILENYPSGASYFTDADFEYFDGSSWVSLFRAEKSVPNLERAFTGVLADSVRIVIHAVEAPSSWYNRVACIHEFEVDGIFWGDMINVALDSEGATALDNGYFDDYGVIQDGPKAIDGDPRTCWAGLAEHHPQVLTIGFPEAYSIDRIRVMENYPRRVSYFTNATFEYFDGYAWRFLFHAAKAAPHLDRSFDAVLADSVRITVNACEAPLSWYNRVACIYAVEVQGAPEWDAINNVALASRGAVAYDNGSFADYGPDQDAALAIDDDSATYWAGLELMTPQRMTVGFDQAYRIDRIRIRENHSSGSAYFTDADFEYHDGREWLPLFRAVKTGQNMDRRFPAVVADSVRISVNGSEAPASWYNKVACIHAFEVNGSGIAQTAGLLTGTTLLATAYDNGSFDHPDYQPDQDALRAVDGDLETFWAGLEENGPQTMTIGFARGCRIDRIRILENYSGGVSYFTDADFEYYDGNGWQLLFSETKNAPDMDRSFPAVVADSVRIVVHGSVAPPSWFNQVACISEFEVYTSSLSAVRAPDAVVSDLRAYPNPFNPRTTIRFTLGREAAVALDVYDLKGRRVRRLVDGRAAIGRHEVSWDGTDGRGARVASGTYFYVLKTDVGRRVGKMNLIK